MSKRKKESDDLGYGSYAAFGEDDPTRQKKTHPGCIIAIIVVGLIAVAVTIALFRRNASVVTPKPSPTPAASPTYDLSDADLQVSNGVSRANYDPSGKQISLSDLMGNTTQADQSVVPVSLPFSLSANNLRALDGIAYPEGALFDPQTGQLVVFGQPARAGASPSSSDFLVALRTVYNGEFPGVSIDPTESKVEQTVRYIGLTEQTNAGRVMFESDRLMKSLSLGEDNFTGLAVTSNVPGNGSMFDFEDRLGDHSAGEERRRFWIVVPDVVIEEGPGGQSMFINSLSLKVKTEYLDSNWETLTVQPPDPSGQAFAQQLSSHFDEYAQEFPVFDDLKALAYWTALATWIQQSNLPIDAELFLAQSPQAVETPKTTPAITVTRQETQENVIQTISLWGGVDLTINLSSKPASDSTQNRFQRALDWAAYHFTSPDPDIAVGISPASSETGFTTKVQLYKDISASYQFAGVGTDIVRKGWLLDLPYIRVVQAAGATDPSAYIFVDPSDGSSVTLTPGGWDAENDDPLFTDVKAGWRLEQQPDGLTLIQGNFTDNGTTFEFGPDQYMHFNLDGQILEKAVSGIGITQYSYTEGQLESIESPQDKYTLQYNSLGQMQTLDANAGQFTFTYGPSALPDQILDMQAQPLGKFNYDAESHQWTRQSATGEPIQIVRFDPSNRVSLVWQANQGMPTVVLYDWQPGQSAQLYSGEALLPWWEASDQNLDDLKAILRLQKKSPEFAQFLFARIAGERLLILVTDQTYSLPKALLQNPGKLRAALSAITKQTVGIQSVLISPGEAVNVGFQNLIPGALPFYIEEMDEARIVGNLASLQSPRGLSPGSGNILNGIPLPEQLEAAGLVGVDPDSWTGKFAQLDAIIQAAGFTALPGGSTQLQNALSSSPAFLIVVAHSDGTTISLPDGSKFSIDDLTAADVTRLQELKPIVFFLSCDSGTAQPSVFSFGKNLLDKGPSLVVAPSGKLPVDSANELVQNFLSDPSRDTNILQAFQNALLKTFPDGLIPNPYNDGSADRFFKLIIGENLPVRPEA